MVYQLSEDEQREAQAIEANYVRLLKECEQRARELRPETGDPADTYTSFEAYLEAGSEEWKATRRRRIELFQQYNTTMNDYFNNRFDEHFQRIADDPEAIVQDAFDEINVYIPRTYNFFISEYGSGFSHVIVRATDDGFLLDSNKIIVGITDLLAQRHTKHLQKADIDRINEYIVKVIAESPYTSSEEGELLGKVTKKPRPVKIETTEGRILAVRPKNYVTTVDRLTKQIFSNEITLAKDDDPTSLYEVPLDGENGNICVYSALNYQELLSSGEIQKIPKMTDWDYGVHDAIVTLIGSGNRVMSYDMMYRAMTGKITGKITVTDEIRKDIDAALDKFRGIFRAEYDYINEDGELVTRTYDEPLVTFQRITDRVKVNGKIIAGGIRLPDDIKYDPPLLKWARFNGNEIDTRDITLLDVPKLNNGDESYVIKMCLYRRIISMRNEFERKNRRKRKKSDKYELADNRRTIRYDYVYAALHEEFQDQEGKSIYQDPDTNKRRLLKDKIDRCVKYWTNKGLITGYNHKRDKSSGNAYYAVMVSFIPKE